MQTFLPYSDFKKTAQVLDMKRLGKQRVECRQILDVLFDTPNKNGKIRKGWINHPAVKMWRGYEYYLCMYGIAICEEWLSRGYKDSQLTIIKQYLSKVENYKKPHFISDEKFLLSHQSNLMRKKPEYYKQFFPNVPDDLEYVWPVE